ncbi:hypothetical protein AURDEDRAFT_186784 [Auricularia subglabra TFB-10046 SS5]|uniref:F-box domain-containing protein n=1 Tax=Auricularia subglabra (strain TFB-10046 / SS5) TaxID=717982 RepID=J0WYJ5_AURST|nr:hypothetical protein AURDEDRAFT_186784 [Auricularia subglabra TFB-10046 SS5]
MFSVWHNADAARFSADTSALMAYTLQMVVTVLREVSRNSIPAHPLCRLPRAVLCNIRARLTLPDILALARSSAGLYYVVFYSPEIWTNISTPSGEPLLIHSSDLQAYIDYSVAEPLRVSLLSIGDVFCAQMLILAGALPRVTTLHLDCCDVFDESSAPPGSLHGSNTWSRLLDVLTEPAPHLTSLRLQYVLGHLIDLRYPSITPVEIDYPLFGGVAPQLRRCRLASIRLPATSLCGAFRDVTMFSYYNTNEISPSVIALILEAMPRLQVLELEGFQVAPPESNNEQHEEAQCASLRVVMCSFILLSAEQLSHMLPFEQLQELWLVGGGTPSVFTDLAKLYPGTSRMWLGRTNAGGLVGSLDAGRGVSAHKVVCNGGEFMRLDAALAPFASITSLSLDEHLLRDCASGPPPPMPTLIYLCVRLASLSEFAAMAAFGWRNPMDEAYGFLVVGHEDTPWDLPALREVRIGVPAQTDACNSGRRASRADYMGIALHDVARWIDCGLRFGPPGAKLDAVVLSGVWVADLDFCAGWNALTEETVHILLEEESDPRYFPTDDMRYQTRSASLFTT